MISRRKKVNSKHKDRLFKWVFHEKKDLMQLYNAINDTNYDNPEDFEVNTLEDVVYMGMKNDLSFLVKDVLNLYEHQIRSVLIFLLEVCFIFPIYIENYLHMNGIFIVVSEFRFLFRSL